MTIRRGSISGPGFKATAYKGSDAAFRGRIAVERGSGMVEFPSLTQLPRILREEGISTSVAEQAFGRERLKANSGDAAGSYTSVSRRTRITVGGKRTRRMKLGHVGTRGAFTAGTRRGSLLLLDAKSGKIVWGAIEEIPGVITSYLTNRAMSVDSVLAKTKTLKIPPQAVYDAFGHLMTAAKRRTLLASFHGMNPAKNRRR